MFPKTYIDKTVCLESLVGVRTGCAVDADYPFWIEDIEGVDVKRLSNIAKPSNLKGVDLAKQLINSSAREMMGDIDLLLNNGYKINSVVGDLCSSCTLLPSYIVDSGIIIKSIISSQYQVMRLTKLNILANVTGVKQIVFDDGVTQETFDITLASGVIMPIKFNYTTFEKTLKIYFADPTVGLGQISCATVSSCGCGGVSANPGPVVITGMVAGVENAIQYGFIPCVTVECSNDTVVCSLINSVPNIFGLALLFKIGEKYYANRAASDRNNEAVSYNEEGQSENGRNYGRLYWAKMQGAKDRAGLKKIMNDFLKTKRNDKCVICEAKITTAYVTG